jgi:cyclic pyranopterin phosphate synthase
MLKTCLYDDGVMNIKDLVREGYTNEALKEAITGAIKKKVKDGWEAERNRKAINESMAAIGG